jgi:hypothetical protein
MTYKLSDKAMLVVVNVSTWTASKLDKTQTDKATHDARAHSKALRVNKSLLPDNALADVTTAKGALRTFNYAQTSPWLDDGARILASKNFSTWRDGIEERKTTFIAEVDKFLAQYEALREKAPSFLGDAFNPIDYPTRDKLEKKFGCDVTVLPMPDAKDWRVDVGDRERDRIQRDIEARTKQALHGITLDAFKRTAKIVGNMVERLTDADATFRDTLVSNVSDLIELLPRLDAVGDPAIASLCADLAKLTVASPDALRSDKAMRASVANDANAILAHVSEFLD